ncbi:NAD(P)-dependent oxidoreductase [Nocardia sp. NRRL S-836]|uniref:NAD-dependent epimerase/dehydratase family protein n=1 Tax=Nocardia sp. NRRL S-836 TaxID=1519492 RepID=UPI0006ADB57D|nr:NAD-dependent epimerase/dehydratase family protein [Nocardia sp. NRRL S-836]
MKTIVIGGTGYTGRHVVDACLREGHEVSVVARSPAADLPSGVVFHQGDASALSHEDWLPILDGHEALVFAAGVDSRAEVPPPSNTYFRHHNVDAVERMMRAARKSGITSAVIHGSYNMTLHRQYPELKLPERHPYIASRADQAIQARAAAGPGCSVAVLEIPYVFGRTPNRPNQFEYMIPWLNGTSNLPLMAPPGGTALVSAAAIGTATCTALNTQLDGDYPVAQANMTWHQLVSRLSRFAGHPDPDAIRSLPGPVFRRFMQFNGYRDRLRGVDSGLDFAHYGELYTSKMFIPECVPELGIDAADLDSALRETVAG